MRVRTSWKRIKHATDLKRLALKAFTNELRPQMEKQFKSIFDDESQEIQRKYGGLLYPDIYPKHMNTTWRNLFRYKPTKMAPFYFGSNLFNMILDWCDSVLGTSGKPYSNGDRIVKKAFEAEILPQLHAIYVNTVTDIQRPILAEISDWISDAGRGRLDTSDPALRRILRYMPTNNTAAYADFLTSLYDQVEAWRDDF